jgi:hypothetical protein
MVHAWVGKAPGKSLFDLQGGGDPVVGSDDESTPVNNMPVLNVGPRTPVVMTDGPRTMKMLPVTGKLPTWAEVTNVYNTLHAAQTALARYADPAAARTAGYAAAPALYVAGPGSYYLNRGFLAAVDQGHFDATRPPVLIYTTVHGRRTLAGVMYALPQSFTPQQLAQVFPASMASWEQLMDTCVSGTSVLAVYDKATCAAQRGQFTARTDWLLPAWIGQAGDTALFDMHLQQ